MLIVVSRWSEPAKTLSLYYRSRVSLPFIMYIMHGVLSTASSLAVTVSNEDLTCWTPESAAWSLTCKVTIPDDTEVLSVQVKALSRYDPHSIIAKCGGGKYTFSSFAQSVVQSNRECSLPREATSSTFRIPFYFTNVTADADGRLSFPVRNISCGAVVYSSKKDYELYTEQVMQDLIQCVAPTIELPSIYHVIDGHTVVVTCSAMNGTPEASVLLTVTPAANQSSVSVSGMNKVCIPINASTAYHRAQIRCTVVNHAHYLAQKTSEIFVYHISDRASVAVASLHDVLNCSERVDSFPDAEYKWFMDGTLIRTEPIFTVSCLETGELSCLATNSAMNASVNVSYTLDCRHWIIFFGLTTSLNLLLFCLMCIPVLRWIFRVRRMPRKKRKEALNLKPSAQATDVDDDLTENADITMGESWS